MESKERAKMINLVSQMNYEQLKSIRKYCYVIIMCTNEVDEAFLKSFFKLEKQMDYKTSRVGTGYAVLFDKFSKLIENLKKGK